MDKCILLIAYSEQLVDLPTHAVESCHRRRQDFVGGGART